MAFADDLAAWLPGQRWFAGKGTPITGLTITADTVLVGGDPGLRHLIVTVDQDSGTDRYQVLIGVRAHIPDRLRHAVIGPAGPLAPGRTGYDALHDPELTKWLLEAMAGQESAGPLRFGAEPGATIPAGADSLVLTAEQSNTSLVFGDEAILKVFRRPAPGPNADLDIPRALAQRGSPHAARPLGWLQTTLDGQPTVLAVLSDYLKSATDGWSLAATSVRDLFASDQVQAAEAGGDFAPEAHRLGEATAEVHRTLADAFGTSELPPGAHRELAGQMLARLDAALAEVPELAACAGLLASAFHELATIDEPLLVQRIHGDYHLGQVMRTPSGWVVLDFEGEPAAPPDQRRARASVLRDVAGMLRSFDYAARHQLPGHPDGDRVRAAARDWVSRNQSAFCDGYAQAGGTDPGKHATLLRALVLDKAVYEVRYEARHRPDWLPIPLESIADA
ncbi:MAG TPA: aminoglycoside phosphotransferase [Streptosporangiaceae bacterium]